MVKVESSLLAVPMNQMFCSMWSFPSTMWAGSLGKLEAMRSMFHWVGFGISMTERNSAK